MSGKILKYSLGYITATLKTRTTAELNTMLEKTTALVQKNAHALSEARKYFCQLEERQQELEALKKEIQIARRPKI